MVDEPGTTLVRKTVPRWASPESRRWAQVVPPGVQIDDALFAETILSGACTIRERARFGSVHDSGGQRQRTPQGIAT